MTLDDHRRRLIRELYTEHDLSFSEVAALFKIRPGLVRKILVEQNVEIRRPGRPRTGRPTLKNLSRERTTSLRDLQIKDRFKSGEIHDEIAKDFGISRERIRQILKSKFNMSSKDGGRAVLRLARVTKDALAWVEAQRRRSDRIFNIYGCTAEEWKKIGTATRNTFRDARRNSTGRGIRWELSLRDWYNLWMSSGHYGEWGKTKGSYVLGRRDKSIGYTVSNCFICPIQEYWRNIRLSHVGTKPACPAVGVYRADLRYAKPFRAHLKNGHKYFSTLEEALAARKAEGLTVKIHEPETAVT